MNKLTTVLIIYALITLPHNSLHAAETASTLVPESAPEKPEAEHMEVDKDDVRETHQVLTGAELVASDYPGSWPMFGTGYRMKIGGYVKVDALEDFNGTGDKYQFLISQIPVDGTPGAERNGYFNMFVRESRFNFDIRKSATSEPAQQVFIEMDFFDETSPSPRLRHAYFVYGNLLAGQTWSTLVDLRSIPTTIDFAYGNLLYSGRPVQIRWQQQYSENLSWAAAIEMPKDEGIDNPNNLQGIETTSLPALVARLNYESNTRFMMLGVALGQLSWDGEGLSPDATAFQWAVTFEGRRYFENRDYTTWNLSYGDGTADNITALVGSNSNATLTADGQLETNEAFNIALGYARKINQSLTSNIVYAWTALEASDLRDPESIRRGSVGHVNLIWSLTKAFSTGVEYMWGTRENLDGGRGDAARVQAMAKYSF